MDDTQAGESGNRGGREENRYGGKKIQIKLNAGT